MTLNSEKMSKFVKKKDRSIIQEGDDDLKNRSNREGIKCNSPRCNVIH